MGVIGEILGTPLGYLMKLCYVLVKDYGLAIIIFTLLTKVILFPVSLMVQKNSIKMIKMKPKLDALKHEYVDDKDALIDAESALYKEEKYSPVSGVIPLLIQLPIIFGLIDVVYRPLKHILHFPAEAINAFIAKTSQITGIVQMGSSPELLVMKSVSNPDNYEAFMALAGDVLAGSDVADMIAQIKSVNMNFLGFDLAAIPSLGINWLLLIPILAGLSALVMCIIQNKINVLQIEQSALSQWGMTLFMIAFSTYFSFLVPAGVGIYWIFGNLFSIPVMYLVNKIYSPKEYIDYATLGAMKKKAKADQVADRANNKLSQKYYREICKGDNLQKMNLMFYSEQSGFYKYFQNIIEALLASSDEIIHYVTSDPNDQIFHMDNPKIKAYYIAGNQLIALMMKLECKVVVMTTPDLGKYHIKRSRVRKNIEYIYVDHACSSLNMSYRTGAFDYFDTIFAVSQSQGVEIREIEKLRRTKKKRIVKVGYGLIDNMVAAYNALPPGGNERSTILVAPSWQYDNILDSCIDDILSQLIGERYRVIVRPHPQYVRRFPLQMEALIEKYRGQFDENFSIETDFSSNVTVYTADLVITDWSSIAYEFSFTANKPSLFIDTQIKVVNKDYEKIDVRPFDITGRNIVGMSISKAQTAKTAQAVGELLANQASYSEQIENLKNSYFYNLGSSGEAGAAYIMERLSKRSVAAE